MIAIHVYVYTRLYRKKLSFLKKILYLFAIVQTVKIAIICKQEQQMFGKIIFFQYVVIKIL